MYIYERMIGVSVYIFALMFVFLLIYLLKRKYLGKILFFYTLLLSFMAYYYIPTKGADLYTLTLIMKKFSAIEFFEFIRNAFSTSTPFADIYLYSIGKLGNANLLPAITAFIYYSNVFYIFKRSSDIFKTPSKINAVFLFLLMSTGEFIGIISGIRNHLAFSIIAVCIFREMVEKKSLIWSIPFYIIAGLMHNAAIVLILLRFAFVFFQNSHNRKAKAIFIAASLIMSFYLFTYGQFYLMTVFNKAKNYIIGNSYSESWGYLIALIIVVIIISMKYLFKKEFLNKYTDIGLINIYKFSSLILTICIIFIFEYNIFYRFIHLLLVISLPWLLKLYESEELKVLINNRYINIEASLFFVSWILLLISGSRGNLSALKFFVK